MGFSVEKVVPWGRSEEEYRAMFSLSLADPPLHILGCGDGPAAFNRDWSRRGGRVVSCDPLYSCSASRIQSRIEATFGEVLHQLEQNRADYLWETIPSVQALGEKRMEAMQAFLEDFTGGATQGRYIAGALPDLPFADQCFDLALASHVLFLYSDHLTARFHHQAIAEMLRVAREVRIFPVLTLDGRISPHLDGVMETFSQKYELKLVEVNYEFQRGGNQMLKITNCKPAAGGKDKVYA